MTTPTVPTGDLIAGDFAEDAAAELEEIVCDAKQRLDGIYSWYSIMHERPDAAKVAVQVEEILADARKRLSKVLNPARRVAKKRLDAITPPNPEPANGSSKETPKEPNEGPLCRICDDEIAECSG